METKFTETTRSLTEHDEHERTEVDVLDVISFARKGIEDADSAAGPASWLLDSTIPALSQEKVSLNNNAREQRIRKGLAPCSVNQITTPLINTEYASPMAAFDI